MVNLIINSWIGATEFAIQFQRGIKSSCIDWRPQRSDNGAGVRFYQLSHLTTRLLLQPALHQVKGLMFVP